MPRPAPAPAAVACTGSSRAPPSLPWSHSSEARRAKHIRSKNLALAIRQLCLGAELRPAGGEGDGLRDVLLHRAGERGAHAEAAVVQDLRS